MIFLRLAIQPVDVDEEFYMDIDHDIPTTCHTTC